MTSYWFWRMNSLGKKATLANDRSVVMAKRLEEAKKRPPDAKWL